MFKREKKPDLTDLQVQQQEFDEIFAMPTNEVIEQIDAVLQRRFPDYYASLNPGLTLQEIDTFESKLGVTFPEDYKSLLRWKDGSQSDNAPYWGGLFCGHEKVLQEAERMMEITREPRFSIDMEPPFDDINNWWNPNWIPLIRKYASNNMLCIDTVGSFSGKPGQIVEFINSDNYRAIRHENIYRWLLSTYAMLLYMEKNTDEELAASEIEDIIEWTDRQFAIERIANPGYPIFFPS